MNRLGARTAPKAERSNSEHPTPTSFLHPVRAARTAAGYTQQSLADTIGVTRQTIISIEGGEYAPSVLLAIRIARCCDSTVEALWGAAADANP
jgi:putative transcriptional regulator